MAAPGKGLARNTPPGMVAGNKLLILSIKPTRQAPVDLLEISDHVRKIAPEIDIFIAQPGTTAKDIPTWKFPTLVVSFYSADKFIPLRGRILQNKPIGKLEQFTRFTSVGLPTPYTERFIFGRAYERKHFGRFVVIKPLPLSMTSTGRQLLFCETSELRKLCEDDFEPQHLLRRAPALVQQFIDTGTWPEYFRVLTLFGQPILWMRVQSALKQIDLSAEVGNTTVQAIVDPRSTYGSGGVDVEKLIEFSVPNEVLAFATEVNRAFPEIPLQACDILREATTGTLYIVEINAGGNTWDFSSRRVAQARNRMGGRSRLVELYDPWPKAAWALVRKVREMAT